jgi:hypothetical protein
MVLCSLDATDGTFNFERRHRENLELRNADFTKNKKDWCQRVRVAMWSKCHQGRNSHPLTLATARKNDVAFPLI